MKAILKPAIGGIISAIGAILAIYPTYYGTLTHNKEMIALGATGLFLGGLSVGANIVLMELARFENHDK